MSIHPVRDYFGRGKITFQDRTELDCNFKFFLYTNGNGELYCEAESFSPVVVNITNRHAQEEIQAKFIGDVENPNGNITIRKIYYEGANINFNQGILKIILKFYVASKIQIEFDRVRRNQNVTIKYGLTNFIFGGCEWIERNNGRYRDKFTVNIENKDIEFIKIENYRRVFESLKKSKDVRITAEAIATIKYGELENFETIMKSLLQLLSYATGTYVAYLYQDIYYNSNLVKTILFPSRTHDYHHREYAINTDHLGHCDLKTFLETVFDNYKRLKGELGLNIFIDYCILSKLQSISEIKYLLETVGMECITSYLSAYFRRRGATAQHGLNNFKNKIKSLFAEFNINYQDSELRFIKLRDKIVHTGRFPPRKNAVEEYRKLMNILDRTILTIIGYRGRPYVNIVNNYNRENLS